MSSSYKVSRYTHVIPTAGGARLLFNALSCSLARLDEPTFSRYQSFADGVTDALDDALLKQLQAGRFIVHDQLDEVALVRSLHYQSRFNASALTLTLAPTLACNFACTYCYEAPAGQNGPRAVMGQAVQDAIVQFAQRQLKGKVVVGVSWYGGEPLLCLNVIEQLTPRLSRLCEEHSVQFFCNIVTNGYLLTPETQARLLALGIRNAQVTLDGPEPVHNGRRPLHGGKGSYRRIVENLVQLNDGLRVALRINLDKRNRPHIPALLEDLVANGLHLKPNVRMYFAPVTAVAGSACSDMLSEHCYTHHEFADDQRGVIDEALLAGVPVLSYPGNIVSSCGAISPYSFVIDSDGALYKCWEEIGNPQRRVGHVLQPSTDVENAHLSRWQGWTPFKGECEGCAVLPVCMSGCPYRSLFSSEGETQRCAPLKFNLNETMVAHYQAKADPRTATLAQRLRP